MDSFIKFGKAFDHPSLLRALPPIRIKPYSTKIDFAKNQQSPSLISLSPLITSQLSILQHTRDRPFKWKPQFFGLLITRSLGFGYKNTNKEINVFSYASLFCFSKLVTFNSLVHYAKGQSPAFRLLDYILHLWVLFTLFLKGLFTFPSKYFIHYWS